ncbi:MAG: 2-C-methyl-D-erythritol 4-phosphate cytidylyltransferase [Deltaproteobacteria bacterium]|jgi:2-C-methyl-D-erythritol 4-phosphate cytidylyltransferase|nr:2-C-methyl-D-erythritol 4-phosphate cytidylyltransferase [Deltaproteobacteria bacterium]
MSDAVRKQYIALDGIPMLSRTLSVFDGCDRIDRIIMAVPGNDVDFCRNEIIPAAGMKNEPTLVIGGERRQDSVYNSLASIETDDGVVLIHDGVRPFVKPQHLVDCIKGAREYGACILGIPAFDTVKQVNAANEILLTQKRDALWLAQTPQAFEFRLIKKAHEVARQDGFEATDDASLVERLGAVVKIIPGSRSNIKITNREDLKLARDLLKANATDV